MRILGKITVGLVILLIEASSFEVMCMKKIKLTIVLLVVMEALCAEGFKLSGGAGFGYMNHYVISKYEANGSFKELIEPEPNALTKGNATVDSEIAKKLYNSLMVGLDVRLGGSFTYSEFGGYFSMNLGFPFDVKLLSPSPLDVFLKSTNATTLNSSFITDTQAGLYVNLFAKRPLQLSLGAGLAFNWTRVAKELPVGSISALNGVNNSPFGTSSIESISEKSDVKMVGVGFKVGVTYFFSKSVGFFCSLNNSCYFHDMANDWQLIGKLGSGETFTYKIEKDGKIGNADVANFGTNSFANNFMTKVGFSFKI